MSRSSPQPHCTPRPSSRWLLAAAATGLALLLAEGVLRLDYRRKVAEVLAGRSEEELITRAAPPPLLYRLKPGIPGVTNAQGFRDLERSELKEPGVLRIAVVGDSLTMQMTLPFEELWVRRLEELLAHRLPGRRLELLNFGITGYGTYQQAALLEAEVPRFEPDALLWQFHYNDAADPVIDGANGGLGIYYGRPRFYLRRHFQRRFSHWRQRRAARGLTGLPPELRQQLFYWERMEVALDRVRRLAHERDLPVYLFVFPRWPEGDDWSRYGAPALAAHRRLVARFEELGFATLDLLPLLAATDSAPLREAPDDPWHPGREGHRWLAERLADWLAPLVAQQL